MSILNSTKSTILPVEEITPIVERIVDRFRPEQIVLFGSHARQTAHADSDIDLLVVMETTQRSTRQAIDILRVLDYKSNLDLIVRTPKTLHERLKLGDSFLQDIINEGVVLYANTDG